MIRCTDTHPFQVKDKGWVKAERLQPGDLIYDKDWNTTPVERVEIIHLADPVEVFNFEVEDCHTYYVGHGCWLVHNYCKQEMVAGDKNGWNARVSVGGEQSHAVPHAHIYFKNKKLASVNAAGEILVQNFGKHRGGLKFVKENLAKIAAGINKWWFYGS